MYNRNNWFLLFTDVGLSIMKDNGQRLVRAGACFSLLYITGILDLSIIMDSLMVSALQCMCSILGVLVMTSW